MIEREEGGRGREKERARARAAPKQRERENVKKKVNGICGTKTQQLFAAPAFGHTHNTVGCRPPRAD